MKFELFSVVCHKYSDKPFYFVLQTPQFYELRREVAETLRKHSKQELGKPLTHAEVFDLTDPENITLEMEGFDGSTQDVINYLEEANA